MSRTSFWFGLCGVIVAVCAFLMVTLLDYGVLLWGLAALFSGNYLVSAWCFALNYVWFRTRLVLYIYDIVRRVISPDQCSKGEDVS